METTPAVRWAPLGVYGLTSLVFLVTISFEVAAASRMPALQGYVASASLRVEHSWETLASHLEWRAAVVLFLGALVIAVAVAAWNVLRALRTDRGVGGALVLGGFAVGVLAYVIFSRASTNSSLLAQLLDLVKRENAKFGDARMPELMLGIKGSAEVLAGLVGMGMAAILVFPKRWNAEILSERVSRLRMMLLVSSIMLVLSVFMTRAAYGWLFSMFLDVEGQAFEAQALGRLADTGTRLAGSVYSLMLAVMYIPSALILQRHSLHIAKEAVQDENAEVTGWLQKHGLKFEWRGPLTRLAVVLAPFLSSVLPELKGLFE